MADGISCRVRGNCRILFSSHHHQGNLPDTNARANVELIRLQQLVHARFAHVVCFAATGMEHSAPRCSRCGFFWTLGWLEFLSRQFWRRHLLEQYRLLMRAWFSQSGMAHFMNGIIHLSSVFNQIAISLQVSQSFGQ